ncbi:MAG: methyl-accepting chemotaxis protein [Deltaproteobacteria bacterium]|nr:MAG: methyl-accepting chemotaxis protein [Deltaproteobacteria bacterium]
MTIRNKLIFSFLVSTITPIILLCVITGNNIKKDSFHTFNETTNTELKRIENLLYIFMDDIKENAVMVSKNPHVSAADESITSFLQTTSETNFSDSPPSAIEKRIIDLFHAMRINHKNYVDVFMGTKFGGFIYDDKSTGMPPGYDPRTRSWYKKAISNPDSPLITKAYKSTSGDAVISICQAVSHQGDLIGAMGFDISLKSLTQFISDIHIGKTGYVMLIQDDGVILADPGHSEMEFKKLEETNIKGLAELGKHSSGSLEIELDGKKYIAQILTSKSLGWKLAGLIQKSEVMSKVYSHLSAMIIAGGILVVIFGITAFFMAKSLSSPIIRATSMFKDIAQGEGNLTKRLEIHSKDELGDMAHWFNRFVENLQEIIGELKSHVNVVNYSSAELLNVSNEMNTGSNKCSHLAKTVSKASEILNGNMINIAAAMEQTAQNTHLVATASDEMSATINEIAKNSEDARQISKQAVEQMQRASEKMHRFGSAAESISTVTDSIADISAQTNLLALNATIEAARAGEAGKGFAVVASEIKELALQTAEATADIKQQIEGLQINSKETIGAIKSVNKVIKDINTIIFTIATAIEQQNSATQEIASNISQVSQGTQDVNENIAQSSEEIDKSNKDISSIETAAQNIFENSTNIVEHLEKLKDMARDLTGIINRFII